MYLFDFTILLKCGDRECKEIELKRKSFNDKHKNPIVSKQDIKTNEKLRKEPMIKPTKMIYIKMKEGELSYFGIKTNKFLIQDDDSNLFLGVNPIDNLAYLYPYNCRTYPFIQWSYSQCQLRNNYANYLEFDQTPSDSPSITSFDPFKAETVSSMSTKVQLNTDDDDDNSSNVVFNVSATKLPENANLQPQYKNNSIFYEYEGINYMLMPGKFPNSSYWREETSEKSQFSLLYSGL